MTGYMSTVEAGRPDSLSREKLEAIRRHPVTRISVNPQTMNDRTLEIIGRRHTVAQTVEAFGLARDCGFDNINMDLIVGLPGESKLEVAHTLEEVQKLDPDSLTVHSLAVKRAARLNMFRDQYREMTFENNQEIMDMTTWCAYEMGMGPYYLYRQKNMAGNFENVGYAKVDKAGIYNILIMEEKQPIIALGAGGSTKLVFDHGRRIERVENVKDVSNYIARVDEMIERKRRGITTYL
ncbi:MAG: coproporphyrinogen dehydrogenase HemZ [Blautia sp.]